jgi:hypothetical protein
MRILSPSHLGILSGMGAAQGQGTLLDPASPQKLWYMHCAPACLARRRAALEERLQAVVRLGGIR